MFACLIVKYIFHFFYCIIDLVMTSNTNSEFAHRNDCIRQRILTIQTTSLSFVYIQTNSDLVVYPNLPVPVPCSCTAT